jgi:hypothetical protein
LIPVLYSVKRLLIPLTASIVALVASSLSALQFADHRGAFLSLIISAYFAGFLLDDRFGLSDDYKSVGFVGVGLVAGLLYLTGYENYPTLGIATLGSIRAVPLLVRRVGGSSSLD